MDDEELEQLIDQYYGCSTPAGTELERQTRHRVRAALLCRFRGSRQSSGHDVDDITQEVYLRLCATKHSGTGKYGPGPGYTVIRWLRGIARNCWNDFWRKRRPSEPLEFQDIEGDEDSPEETVAQQEEIALLCAALENLPHQQRRAMQLHLEGQTHAAIAEAMHVAVGTVGATLNHARAHLHQLLGGHFGAGN
jgi:RNA polymerase sigma factor (sigma-70 family)